MFSKQTKALTGVLVVVAILACGTWLVLRKVNPPSSVTKWPSIPTAPSNNLRTV